MQIVSISDSEIGASVYYSSSLGGTYFRIRPDNTYTLSEFKALLQSYNSAGKPLKIYYPAISANETLITLPTINLNKGTNILDVNTNVKPSNMKVTYKKKN